MKKNGIFIVAIFIVSLILPSCGGGGSSSNSPAKTVEKFFSHVKNKNYDKAAELFALKDGTKLSDAEKQKVKAILMAGDENAAKRDGFKKIEILNETVADDGNSGTVDFKIIFGNDEEDKQSYDLKKIDGKWHLIVMS